MEESILEEILPFVSKPGRYLGCEWNSVPKDWEKTKVKVALCYPDLYEIGMSNFGLQILYEIINSRDDSLAERVYSPQEDIEDILKKRNIPLFSLESKRSISDFNILGFTLSSELLFTNVLRILDLSQIPIYSNKRDGNYPLVIAGGPCTTNPEPLADFIDAFVLGDGEEVINEIIETVGSRQKAVGRDKKKLLLELAKIKGVYVPSFYDVEYKKNGRVKNVSPKIEEVPRKIERRTVNLENTQYSKKPILPLVETIHSRFNLEIGRGCPWKCLFCQSRIFYWPYRIRSKEKLLEIAHESIKNTGFDEISLSSLSSTDHPEIYEIIDSLLKNYFKKRISISLPSLRPNSLSLSLASKISTIRKSTLTFAPEAGSKRLREFIGKSIEEDEFMSTISSACKNGWRLIKLYFMIGLPTEEDRDIDSIVSLVNKIKRTYRNLNLNITISPFVPKSQTPFQWIGQENLKSLKKKGEYLRKKLPAKVKYHLPESSIVEGVFARGDRRLSKVIEIAFKNGSKFDQWHDHFNFDRWKHAFKISGLNMEFYTERGREKDEIFPWDHLIFGKGKESLLKEYETTKNSSRINNQTPRNKIQTITNHQ